MLLCQEMLLSPHLHVPSMDACCLLTQRCQHLQSRDHQRALCACPSLMQAPYPNNSSAWQQEPLTHTLQVQHKLPQEPQHRKERGKQGEWSRRRHGLQVGRAALLGAVGGAAQKGGRRREMGEKGEAAEGRMEETAPLLLSHQALLVAVEWRMLLTSQGRPCWQLGVQGAAHLVLLCEVE